MTDPRTERAREEALAILQPAAKELEHGLQLHADALVCESYGFAPRSAVDTEAINRALEEGASPIEVQDLSEDMSMTRHVIDAHERARFIEAWKVSGVTCILQNAGEEYQDPVRIMKRLARFTYVADSMRDVMLRATHPDDIVRAKEEGKHCFYMSSNGVPLPQRWTSLEEELGLLKIFYQLGIRMMHLTYNRRNMIGDGCAEASNAGLSDFGRAVIQEMNQLGIVVDVAHSGQKTSLEAAQLSERPMVASHSAALALNDHFRCKSDEVIKAIADTGGYVGVCCIPRFLGRTRDIVAFLDHIDYLVKRFGADHVAIGTDIAYRSPGPPVGEGQKKSAPVPRPKQRPRWEAYWPDGPSRVVDPSIKEREGKGLVWTNWPLFTVGMVQRGHSDDDIRKILGGNVLRVVKAALPGSENCS
ncbi:MAG: dipeptidase [Limnochordia bacterium]|jgi:membrane dipeptidase